MRKHVSGKPSQQYNKGLRHKNQVSLPQKDKVKHQVRVGEESNIYTKKRKTLGCQ